MSCEQSHFDGAYVLGALSPEERLAFERHLSECHACRRSVQQLAGLPGLLSQVSVDVLESEPVTEPVPATLLPALEREVRRSQHRRRWVTGLAAAAAAVVVGAGSVAAVDLVRDDPPATVASRPAQDMKPLGQHDVVARVALTSVAWGTRLDLVCSYEAGSHAYGGAPGPTYSLVVRSREGTTEQVGTWSALPGRTMRVTGATALSRDDILSVEVRAADGQPVLALNG
jgi:hypothetical protein